MVALRLWFRLARRQDDQRLTVTLAVIAFAAATGALLTVLGGLGAFVARGGDQTYVTLAQLATVILLVPVLTVGGAAARLAVSRRDERLAALRLAGATSAQVGVIAVADAAAQALLGALAGVVVYLVALPGVALLRFQGRAFGWAELWVGGPTLLLAVLGVVVLAVLSAVLGLARIVVSPLGVARRVSPRRLSRLRVIIALVLLGAWVPLVSSGTLVTVSVVLVVFGLCFGVLNLLGPFVLSLIGRFRARRARNAESLLAARRLLDDPRSAWRTVSGVTLATFVAGVLSISPALSADRAGDPATYTLSVDLLTGALVTLVIAAVLAAVSSGVTQAARLLDQREQYRLLHLAGTDTLVLKRARMAETMLPLVASVSVAAGVALVMIAPFGLALVGASPWGLVMFGGGLVAAVGLVLAAVALSQPMVDRVVGP